MEKLVTLVGAIVGLTAGIMGLFLSWKSKIEKNYSRQQDYEYLKRNYENLNANLNLFIREQDARFDKLDSNQIEMKSMIVNLLVRKPVDE